MSAFAALAVASPAAVIAVSDLSDRNAPQHREFVQAAMVTDLPGELIGALSQGLSQFGINLPPAPTGVLTGSTPSPSLASPSLTSPGLAAPGVTTPGLTAPGLTAPGAPGLTTPALTTPGLSTPGLSVPPVTATAPGLADAGLTNPALTSPGLTNPALTSPAAAAPGGLPGLTTPGLDPALTPISSTPGLGVPGEIPISAPIADPALGSYPILGDPSLAAAGPVSTGSTGLIGDLSSAANQLGAGQAIDLLKGMVMPAITSAMKGAVPPPVPAPAPPAPPA
jgi:hypothetical protein